MKLRPISNATLRLCMALTVTLLSSCGGGYRPVKGNLSESELIGRWMVKAESEFYLRSNKIGSPDRNPVLVLEGNHEYRLDDIPLCWARFEECGEGVESFRGKWNLHRGPGNQIWLDLIDMGSGSPRLITIPLARQSGVLLAVFTFGDPDSGRTIFLQRLETP